ncbi:LysR family transcriptional regulator [Eubacteriales bacterium OttesenSCG-928-K08]|nr:LysR family transcriptional regulator [Eubacteriales bacterium OttesenSCG-928-K08]
MEIKQLEFFIAVCKYGSLSKAATRLYTSQPNVSKVIQSLEKELGSPLFDRTSKGLRLTPYGKSIYDYAENVLTNAKLISNSRHEPENRKLEVSTFSSNLISWLIVELYQQHPEITIEHHQGVVEEITDHVAQGISELGILYVSQKQLKAFKHTIAHKKLEFIELSKREACIYVGPHSPLYERESLTIDELVSLRLTRSLNDFFSVEHHLKQVNAGTVRYESLNHVVFTNSEHLATDLLIRTDLASLGINMTYPLLQQYDIKNLRIDGEDAYLTLGYVVEKKHSLSVLSQELLDRLENVLKL